MVTEEKYRIHPSIGVGRLGNSPDSFYLAPETIGGLPIEADENNCPRVENGKPVYVKRFKDPKGQIRRQAATFKVYKTIPGTNNEVVVDLRDESIDRIEWTVHVANKKAAWWNFVPLLGNLMFGEMNSYETWRDTDNLPKDWNLPTNAWTGLPWIDFRNSSVTGLDNRRQLIIDPGPRTISGSVATPQNFDKNCPGYKFVSFPTAEVSQGHSIETLGEARTDKYGNLLVLGGYGYAGGSETITGFGGGDTWHDDIADGPVTATIYFKDPAMQPIKLDAWYVSGSPKYAPELVNISTWDDVIIDESIKYKNVLPDVYDATRWPDTEGWNPDYKVNYDKDIQPFLDRIADYQWVATVPSMTAFIRPAFDTHDNSDANKEQRQAFLRFFRKPSKIRQATEKAPAGFEDGGIEGGQNQQLFSGHNDLHRADGVPLMPLNSGTNSVRNNVIDKFSTLTDTQYYCLKQWADGKFNKDSPGVTIPGIHPLDKASVGNCVGEPMCPGIEVTWSVRNPVIYSAPYQILSAFDEQHYYENGLNPYRDECQPYVDPLASKGCEPGDLTKRMAIPWQADFYDCSVQMINFVDPNVVKDNLSGIPTPPTYYAYWWPPQAPWNVISGNTSLHDQKVDGIPAGMQVMYSRGVNSFTQMITAWKYLGFIVNQNQDEKFGRQYPYFTEKERNLDRFTAVSVGVGNVSSFITGDDSNYLPAWFLKDEDPKPVNEPEMETERGGLLSGGMKSMLRAYHAKPNLPVKNTNRRRFGH